MVEEPDNPDMQYWCARVEALDAEIDLLRELVWTLSADLPPDRVAGAFESAASAARVLPALVEASAPVASDVKTELQNIWTSLLTPWRHK